MLSRRVTLGLAILAAASACAPASATVIPSAAAGPATAGAAESRADTTRLSVTGTATRSVPADRARIQVAVETENESAAEASRQNAAAMNRVLDAVRPAAGEGARIETTGYQLSPRYRQDRTSTGWPEIIGYQALNQVVVTVEDPDRVGPVLDAALESGANRVAGLDFFASDTESARLEALREATERARAEAELLADALGLVILGAESVSTSGGVSYPRMRAGLAMESMAMDTPVEAGSQTVSATVNITYLLGPESLR